MEKTYQPDQIEAKWYPSWEAKGYFEPQGNGKAYCIMLPPPNVTGSLHIGHAFQDSLMDALIRYHRMMGYQTLWQPGTDHAGIATQMVVERQLNEKGISKHDLTRADFVNKIWEWKAESGNTITRQMRRLGASPAWSKERFTMDEGLSQAVQEVFIRLYDESLIYRGKKLVNWDPKLQTAVSDLEVVSEEEDGFLWYIKYPIANQSNYLTVATTRPETMLGDAAVAVHPEDPRYKRLIGQKIQLPLSERLIDIIADDSVDPEFGTGCVKITPAHDFNDYEIGKRHGLSFINIFDKTAKLNKNVPHIYQGLNRFVARERIVQDLNQKGLLEKIEPHKLKVPRGDRSNEIVEPLLTDQWFVSAKTLAGDAIRVVRDGQIKFVPENWANTYFDWMENIQDWCISRQLWWGHRIPAWYDKDGNVYVGSSEANVREKYNLGQLEALKQDEDVLDTWFSAALWPFSTLGWPEETQALKTFYPTNVLVTGFDIIFFWVARMIMMGLKFTGKVPFHTVFVTGLIQDAEGQKMSKSKGNIIDPLDLIDGISLEKLLTKRTTGLMQPQMANKIKQLTQKAFQNGIAAYGTDALRFTCCALASTGRHIRFDVARVEGNRNFCNKLWNAARFVMMQTEGQPFANDLPARSLADQWIWSQLQKTIQVTHHYFETYRFDLAAQSLYEFTWDIYCDWYLEFSKTILNNPNESPEVKAATRFTLLSILEHMLRLLHPMMPFITEEIWQRLPEAIKPSQTESIMIQPFPKADRSLINEQADSQVQFIKQLTMQVRTVRGEMNISPAEKLPILLKNATPEQMNFIQAQCHLIQALAKVVSIEFLSENDLPPISATTLLDKIEIFLPMAGFINKEAELKRLEKELGKIDADLAKCLAKLNNPSFRDKAPVDVVSQEEERVKLMELAQEKLKIQLKKIEQL
ncbi:MAG: valine--tRNA ligase [Gammaproteobacteria bacterium]